MATTKDMQWVDAIVKVLTDNGKSMPYADIANEIVQKGYRQKVGATPAATVSAYLSGDVKRNGGSGLFTRTSPGEYMLNPNLSPTAIHPLASQTDVIDAASPTTSTEPEDPALTSAVKALGMFWRRDRVKWTQAPKLLGQQQAGATPVDFSPQIGIYLLHDQSRTVYIGRVVDRTLGKRLFEHTTDRLNGRWDRFSWFGLLAVQDSGVLTPSTTTQYTPAQVIFDLEAVLIEALEPPLNRRRGDRLDGVDYIQYEDPAIKREQLRKDIDSIMNTAQQ